jgi:hypothetical protein
LSDSREKQKLKKKIQGAEQQLLDKAHIIPETPTNTQTDRIIPLTTMSEKRRVPPGSKDAPSFKSSKPEQLLRFIDLMEDLWKYSGITTDAEKKAMIGKYADRHTEEEWSAFDTFEEGTWEEFKEELIANYPEAAAAERGTPARIRQICVDTPKVRLGDVTALFNFRRLFMAEARKLLKPPAAMANRELVELFIGCLSVALASAVFQFLGVREPSIDSKTEDSSECKPGEGSKSKAKEGSKKARRPEDKYDLEDVCKAALQVSENSQGMFNLMKQDSSSNSTDREVFVFNQPVSETKALSEKMEELEGVQALERDRLASMNKTMESKLGGLEDLIKSLMAQSQTHVGHGACKGECKSGACKAHEALGGPPQKWGGKSMDNERCFWCGLLGHFQADCDDLKNQIRGGNVKVNPEGKLRLRDGSYIPNQPAGASLKERVERHYARKPSQYFHGEYEDSETTPAVATNALSQFLGTSHDADRRTIAQLKAELDLRKREEALELRQKMLEQNEKKMEQASGSTRVANLLELLGQLTEEEVAAIGTHKSGFN